MPVHIVVTTTAELFVNAIDTSRTLSERILKLADLNATPLSPGETADARRHQIAKLGKALAEAFLTIDRIVSMTGAELAKAADVTAGPVDPPDNTDAN